MDIDKFNKALETLREGRDQLDDALETEPNPSWAEVSSAGVSQTIEELEIFIQNNSS